MTAPKMEHTLNAADRVRYIIADFNELAQAAEELHGEIAPLIPQAETMLPPIDAFLSKMSLMRPEVEALTASSVPEAIDRADRFVKSVEPEFDKLKLETYDAADGDDIA